ncbi:rhomboid family intramembrane serine protease [Curtobacterium flaccumfaciens]|uniref:rhomboid family intramembrane serine protease n=1 Tax=Curtobacterium flaccumfaciens TaxID=2035 RepID=UPI00217D53FA|nr:rhomboid family intramembrane serine protease [Curtobacterium flaccumfaciens]MCS6554542.1 rhomboid family intramembrane serine protease [Curtobacterium flaccumfaciens]
MLDQKGTTVIVAITVAIWLLDQVSGRFFTSLLAYNSFLLPTQPWRVVTSLFVHSGIFHILFNMWALWIFGRMLENMLGTWRFVALYFITGIFGSMLVTFLAPGTTVLGASGAIFGLFAAFFVLQRSLGNNAVQLLVLMGLNLVIGFLPGVNISWQAHVGGIIGGFLMGFVFAQTRNIRKRPLQIALIIGAAVLGVALTAVGYAVTVG